MKFIADAMLGTLAKRMRFFGYDILFDASLHDNEIIRLALEQDRIILTRDLALSRRPLAASRHFLVTSDDLDEQFDRVHSAFPLETPLPLTRCSACNCELRPILKQEARDLVPRQVFDTHRDFLQCPNCCRIYWQGTHVKRMNLRINKK